MKELLCSGQIYFKKYHLSAKLGKIYFQTSSISIKEPMYVRNSIEEVGIALHTLYKKKKYVDLMICLSFMNVYC